MIAIACLGLLGTLGFAMRSVGLSGVYGIVEAELPVMPAPIDDHALHHFSEESSDSLNEDSEIIVLTTESLYFTNLKGITKSYADVRTKFHIKHDQGRPQLEKLFDQIQKWREHHSSQKPRDQKENPLVFLPSNDIPIPIMVQTLAALKSSPLFGTVVLAGGLI